jgi:phthalate 4,5-cis-dihydrodiol dehydrogenase
MTAPASAKASRPLRMAILGLGQGAAGVLPTMASLPEIDLVAVATRNPETRQKFVERFPGARAHADIAGLCTDPNVEAVWVATPNRLHAEHSIELMRHGKHVAVEKPMATTLEEADRMIGVAHEHGVKLLAGHTSSFQMPVRAMRRLVVSGLVGAVKAILIASYTDWMLRPRTPEELSLEAGGGLVHRQAPHQIDALRLIGGGKLRSVRGSVGQWMPERQVPGYYAAFLEFENGLPATIVYDGYGYYMTLEHYPEASARWRYNDEDRIIMRNALRKGNRDEESEKQEFRIGGSRDPSNAKKHADDQAWSSIDDLGEVTLSCERGILKQGKYGVTMYGDAGRREVNIGGFHESGARPALLELQDAVVNAKPLYHSGEWGRATLEATIAILRSNEERREVILERQVEMPASYDADLDLPAPT